MASVAEASGTAAVTTTDVLRSWWPLAVSWLFMTGELVVITAFVARLPDPEVQLAAWGVVFGLSILVQAPATALLPTSTALAHDREAFLRLRRYAFLLLAGLTGIHAVVALTLAYGLVVDQLLAVPAEVSEAARLALVIMLPWTFGTGLRRLLHGVMIRHGDSRVVVVGSLLRLGVGVAIMAAGAAIGLLPGASLAAVAIIVGVLAELGYTAVRVAPVVEGALPRLRAGTVTLGARRFLAFFSPLVLVTLLTMAVQTLVTIAIGRMPATLSSLAVWPVLFGLLTILQSPGFAYTEVVISLLRRPGAVSVLRRCTFGAALWSTLLLVALVATPAADAWFRRVAGLSPDLADLARVGLLLGALVPGLRLLHAFYQGAIMVAERTRGILESVLVFITVAAALLALGVALDPMPGLYVAMTAITLAMAAQLGWLVLRARPVLAPSPPGLLLLGSLAEGERP
jgi:hypothetical protein